MKVFDDLESLLAVLANPEAACDWLEQARASEKRLESFVAAEASAHEALEATKEAQRQLEGQRSAFASQQATAQLQANKWVEITNAKEKELADREAAVAVREKAANAAQRDNSAARDDLLNRVNALNKREAALKGQEDAYAAKMAKLRELVPHA